MRDHGDSAAASTGARRTRLLTVAGFSALLLLALIAVDVAALGLKNPIKAISPHYYMALGNSLSFGYQPNLDFSAGFADDIFTDLHNASVTDIANFACAGETTDTMIHGGCVARFAHHGSYTGAQLQAAVDFLTNARHRGHVSPITLEIGANDVMPDFNSATCTMSASADADLTQMDANLTQTILPSLLKALGTPTGAYAGDLHVLNYYNPFAKECPNSAAFVHQLNDHLQADAAKFRVPVVDVYNAFGGDAKMASNICNYTWMCDARFHDIHPTNLGYRTIANAVEAALGLPGTTSPMLAVAPAPALGALHAARDAAFWRGSALRLA